MKNAVLIALVGGFLIGNVSGYAIRAFTSPKSFQEEMINSQKKVHENWKRTKDDVRESLIK